VKSVTSYLKSGLGLGAIGLFILIAFSPFRLLAQEQGDQIAFASNRDGDFEIYLMDLEGNIFAQLTDNDVADLSPTWNPNGKSVAFSSNIDGDYDIFVTDIASGESQNLTDNGWDDLYPAWSPDGSQIAYTSNRDRNWEIYVMDADGDSQTRVTTDSLYDGNPTWSPDGSQIAFVSDRESKREIKVMDADGGNIRQITSNELGDYNPSWSPDGNQPRITYVSNHDNQGGTPEVYMVDLSCLEAETSCEDSAVNLTLLPRIGDIDPAWSPDGSAIVFASGRDIGGSTDGTKLYIMNGDGSDVRQLSSGNGDDRFPAWWSPS
jgi:Tol biopolymer transport system component